MVFAKMMVLTFGYVMLAHGHKIRVATDNRKRIHMCCMVNWIQLNNYHLHIHNLAHRVCKYLIYF